MSAGWGAAGAFMYAANGWRACVLACTKGQMTHCHLTFAVAMGIGTAAAAAFSESAAIALHWNHPSAVAAGIGLLANPLSPMIIDRASKAVEKAMNVRFGKNGDQ